MQLQDTVRFEGPSSNTETINKFRSLAGPSKGTEAATVPGSEVDQPEDLRVRYRLIREFSEKLRETLEPEDCVVSKPTRLRVGRKRGLPNEFEWEVAAADLPYAGNFAENRRFHPQPLNLMATRQPLAQMFGDVWEWTSSSYSPYPGYAPTVGALGEYNGKFMCNHYVLRGGSCVTSRSHIRKTYRNFFPPNARWQFTGIRLARSFA
jgi:sulfatase-modifying factor enzyme 1